MGLSGELPPASSLPPSLRRLDLSSNALDGSLPANYSLPPSLTELRLENNELSGSLPPEWGLNPNQVVGLFNNSFSGSLPAWSGATGALVLVLPGNGELCGEVRALRAEQVANAAGGGGVASTPQGRPVPAVHTLTARPCWLIATWVGPANSPHTWLPLVAQVPVGDLYYVALPGGGEEPLTQLPACSSSDEQLLLAFKANFTNGKSVLGDWTAGTDACAWTGISCNDQDQVTGM